MRLFQLVLVSQKPHIKILHVDGSSLRFSSCKRTWHEISLCFSFLFTFQCFYYNFLWTWVYNFYLSFYLSDIFLMEICVHYSYFEARRNNFHFVLFTLSLLYVCIYGWGESVDAREIWNHRTPSKSNCFGEILKIPLPSDKRHCWRITRFSGKKVQSTVTNNTEENPFSENLIVILLG